MQNFKNKLYNYEAAPPEQLWDDIVEQIQNEKVIDLRLNRRPRLLFYSATAAASIIIVLFASLFIKHHEENNRTDQQKAALLAQKNSDSIRLNHQLLEAIIHNPQEKKAIISGSSAEVTKKKYLTIAGPEGQPVKISPKVATLILYADNEFPPRPIWSNKICKWQEIMLSSTVSPTSANLVDLIQMAASSDHLE